MENKINLKILVLFEYIYIIFVFLKVMQICNLNSKYQLHNHIIFTQLLIMVVYNILLQYANLIFFNALLFFTLIKLNIFLVQF